MILVIISILVAIFLLLLGGSESLAWPLFLPPRARRTPRACTAAGGAAWGEGGSGSIRRLFGVICGHTINQWIRTSINTCIYIYIYIHIYIYIYISSIIVICHVLFYYFVHPGPAAPGLRTRPRAAAPLGGPAGPGAGLRGKHSSNAADSVVLALDTKCHPMHELMIRIMLVK